MFLSKTLKKIHKCVNVNVSRNPTDNTFVSRDMKYRNNLSNVKLFLRQYVCEINFFPPTPWSTAYVKTTRVFRFNIVIRVTSQSIIFNMESFEYCRTPDRLLFSRNRPRFIGFGQYAIWISLIILPRARSTNIYAFIYYFNSYNQGLDFDSVRL